VSILKQLVFTPKCFNCGRFGINLCPSCLQQIKPFHAKDLTEIQSCFAAGEYAGWLRESIICYKNGNANYSEALATLLGITLETFFPGGSVTLVPIPSSAQKIQERGFDSMKRVCREVGKQNSKFQLDSSILYLRHKVADQVGLSKPLRRINLEGAFGVRQNISGTLVLVDDVVTTGATLNSAARALKLAGAQRIFAVALCAVPKTR
jgi:ComF family protein